MSFSRFYLAGSTLIVAGVLSFEPLLGKYLAADRSIEFPGNAIAASASLFLIATGLLLIYWRTKITFLGISGREVWIRLLLVCFPFILLSIAEVALIAADRHNQPTDADDQRASKLMVESWGKVKYRNFNLFAPKPNPVFKVNSKGFRTYELDTPHGGELRIMLLGGSTAFGWAVADHHGIDKNLERIISARTGAPVKVFNLSIPGVTFSAENQMLEDFSTQISPDVVVFYHSANDGVSWYQQTIGRANSKQSLKPSFFSTSTLLHYAYQSHVFRLLTEVIRLHSPPRKAADIDVSAALEDYETRLAESARHCASTKCVYVIQPIIFNKDARTTREIKIYREAMLQFPRYKEMYQKYTDAILAKSFASHFDARSVLSHSRDDMFVDYIHVSAAGNRLLAQYIADTLCNGGFVRCL